MSDDIHEIADEVATVKDAARLAKPTMRRFSVNVVTYFSLLINYSFNRTAVRSIAANRPSPLFTSP